jgi:hypothetical protein
MEKKLKRNFTLTKRQYLATCKCLYKPDRKIQQIINDNDIRIVTVCQPVLEQF